MPIDTLRELFVYNHWANSKVFALAEGLSEEQLDQPFELGRPTLRETLRHIYGAERIWYERIHGTGCKEFPRARAVFDVAATGDLLRRLHEIRDTWLASRDRADLEGIVSYHDEDGQHEYTSRRRDILLHVCNHGIHHRAQVLNMLRQFGRTLPGLDYLFMRVEYPTFELDAESLAQLRSLGHDVKGPVASPARLNRRFLQAYFRYGDWAFGQVLDAARALSDEQLDRAFEMGCGSVRRNLIHICNGERWWLSNWTLPDSKPQFANLPDTATLDEVGTVFQQTSSERDTFFDTLADGDLVRFVDAWVRPDIRLRFRLGESLLQLCGHGTHHRAQAMGMMRKLGVQPPTLEWVVWART